MKQIFTFIAVATLCMLTISCAQPTEKEQQIGADPVYQETIEAVVDEVSIPVTQLVVHTIEELPDTERLSQMHDLQLLDLTELPEVSISEIETFETVLPDTCRIIWNQRLTDGVFRSDSTSLTLPNATAEDVGLLDVFTDLKTVDASGSTAYSALNAFRTSHPEIVVHYTLTLGDTVLSEDAESIVVPEGTDEESLAEALHAFDRIQEIDLRSSGWDDAALKAFINEFPDVPIKRMIRIGDQSFDSETEMLDLRAMVQIDAGMLNEAISAFRSLKTVALPEEWTESETEAFQSVHPTLNIIGTVTVFGQTLAGTTEEIDLSKTKIRETEEVEELLLKLPFLKKVVLCECGLSDEQMESLCNAHPDVKFVWTIVIGKRKLRTDAIGFSTKNPSKYTSPKASDAYNASVKKAVRLQEGDIEALKYCTDLEALDLGHNYLTNNDLAVISKLTKLKVLILADNKITDISALTSLKDLEYIELFMNRIPDLSPLREMPSLVDVNVCNTGVSDLSPLFELTGVKRLWYAMNPFKREEAKQLKETLADCLCNYTTNDETGEGWREDPRYQWMRAYFKDS